MLSQVLEMYGTIAVIIRTLVYELLCFFLHDLADFRHGWITRAFLHQQERIMLKGTRGDANEEQAHPLTSMVQHVLLHGLIKN